jgi:hypothetical protein
MVDGLHRQERMEGEMPRYVIGRTFPEGLAIGADGDGARASSRS